MKRIDTSTRAIDLFGVGKDGFKDGNLALGAAPTDFNAAWPNGVQEEIMNVVEAAGLAANGADLTQLLKAIRRLAGGASRVMGLVGANNTGAPPTQYDLKADSVVFRTAATGETYTVSPVTVLTNNIATAGPAANGRDQVGAFSASTWVHLHFIFNPTTSTVATLSSASANAPTLPDGYTASAYAGAVVLSAGSQLQVVKMRGAWATYDSLSVVLAGSATVNTPFSTGAFVPPNALEWKPMIQNLALSANAGGVYSCTLFLDSYQAGLSGTGGANAVFSVSGGSCFLPNVGQSAAYRISVSAGSGPVTTIQVQGYKMPNGGE